MRSVPGNSDTNYRTRKRSSIFSYSLFSGIDNFQKACHNTSFSISVHPIICCSQRLGILFEFAFMVCKFKEILTSKKPVRKRLVVFLANVAMIESVNLAFGEFPSQFKTAIADKCTSVKIIWLVFKLTAGLGALEWSLDYPCLSIRSSCFWAFTASSSIIVTDTYKLVFADLTLKKSASFHHFESVNVYSVTKCTDSIYSNTRCS